MDERERVTGLLDTFPQFTSSDTGRCQNHGIERVAAVRASRPQLKSGHSLSPGGVVVTELLLGCRERAMTIPIRRETGQRCPGFSLTKQPSGCLQLPPRFVWIAKRVIPGSDFTGQRRADLRIPRHRRRYLSYLEYLNSIFNITIRFLGRSDSTQHLRNPITITLHQIKSTVRMRPTSIHKPRVTRCPRRRPVGLSDHVPQTIMNRRLCLGTE